MFGGNLRGGKTVSCGCYRAEWAAENMRERSQGVKTDPLYHCWRGMVARCTNPSNKDYSNYGGRGILVHPPWKQSLPLFRQWMNENLGNRPSLSHTLDRIDNDGHYEPGNLRWATKSQQNTNQRKVADLVVERDLWRSRALELGWTADTLD